MTVERIDCATDPRARAFCDVRDGELLRTRGLFVAEGRLVVRRVLADPRYRVESVLVNDGALEDLASELAAIDPPVLVAGSGVLADVAGYDVHRGCLALVRRPEPRSVDETVAAARCVVVLEGVTNADNVGGVFRNAAAFGVDAIVLSPACCDPFYRKAVRTSMGAVLAMPFARVTAGDWPSAVTRLRAGGFTLVALTPREPSETLEAFAARRQPPRLAVIVGSEGEGLSAAVESAADARVRIPISGAVDSLNLATAVGIALYELTGNGGCGGNGITQSNSATETNREM
jgi:tRNA G18 (ribose-2'-O)-methylase SpoU